MSLFHFIIICNYSFFSSKFYNRKYQKLLNFCCILYRQLKDKYRQTIVKVEASEYKFNKILYNSLSSINSLFFSLQKQLQLSFWTLSLNGKQVSKYNIIQITNYRL